MNTEKFKVTCFGAGFVGLPTTSVLALKNPGVEVNQNLNVVCYF